jgi:hypothetical protein
LPAVGYTQLSARKRFKAPGKGRILPQRRIGWNEPDEARVSTREPINWVCSEKRSSTSQICVRSGSPNVLKNGTPYASAIAEMKNAFVRYTCV